LSLVVVADALNPRIKNKYFGKNVPYMITYHMAKAKPPHQDGNDNSQNDTNDEAAPFFLKERESK
jgi:hypothetical protein